MSAAIVLAKFGDPDKLVPAVAQLDSCPPVTRWDAVDGHVNLVIAVNSTAAALPNPVKALPGLSELQAYDIASGNVPAKEPNAELASAYLFIDVEPSSKDAVAKTIAGMPETVSCTSVTGGCDLVAVVSTETIGMLGRLIDEKIRSLDGILRLKHNHIIDLKQL